MSREFDREEISTLADLEHLLPEWNALWSSAPRSTPFQFPAWILSWWRCFGAGALAVLALRDGQRLVAIIPGVVQGSDDGDTFELIGSGISDYQDGLFAAGYEATATVQAFEWLQQMRRQRCQRCRLEHLPENSPLASAAPSAAWLDEIQTGDVCPVLRLYGGDLAACIPKRQAAKLRYYRQRAERCGALCFQMADQSNWSELLDDLIRLHGRSWNRRGQSGVLAGAAVVRFHRHVAPELLRAGVLKLYRFNIDQRAVASLYVLTRGPHACYYIGGFDPEFSGLSPGTLLIGHAIELAMADGAVEFDFLRGQERYKYFWGAQDRPTYRRVLQRKAPLPCAAGV